MTRKRLSRIVGSFALASWLAAAWVYTDYAFSRPKQPIPEEGRVWEISNHGDSRYVTTSEYLLWFGLAIVGIGATGASMWLYQSATDQEGPKLTKN